MMGEGDMGKKGGTRIADRWIILRTSGRCTLPLATSLSEAGFETWTPIEHLRRRAPRAKALVECPVPIMPTYVFARAGRLADLIELSESRVKSHEGFSVFRYFGFIPLLDDRELEGLRVAEHGAVPRRKKGAFSEGQGVRVTKGSFEGLFGVVSRADGRECEVWLSLFGRQMRAKISSFLLQSDDVDRLQPATGSAAQAA